MNEKFKNYLGVRIGEEAKRDLRDIMEACAFSSESEATRFAFKVSRVIIEFMVEHDIQAVLAERQFERAEVTFAEKMAPDELADTLLYFRERLGASRYDMLLRKAADRRRQRERDDVWFGKARKAMQDFSDGPYKYDDLVKAVVTSSLQNSIPVSLTYAKTIVERHLKAGSIKQVGMDKYAFQVKDPAPKEAVR